MQRGTITRCCVLACLAAVLCPLPAATYCAGSQCQPVGLLMTTKCGVGKMGGVTYNVDTRFKGTDFKESCLVNAGVACDHADNAGKLAIKPDTSCCSCYLYAKYCAGKSGFVTNVPHNPSNSDHSLLMPASPCTGVENWNKPGCPGESIWDEGETLLTKAGKDALWGMAINPVSRRGQHQMHVHLAPVTSSLMSAIVAGFKQGSHFYLNCGLTSSHKHLKTCAYSTTKCQDCPEVHIKHQHTNPSGAHPFATAYGNSPSNADSNTLDASTLVLRLPKTVAPDTWAVVVNPYGQAECFFDRKSGSDLATACPQ